MAKNLGEEFTLIIHKHKKPYDTAVIRHFQYTSNERIITDIGVQVDIFKYRKTRKYYYLQKSESLQPPAAKPRGRPKGRKKPNLKSKRKGVGEVLILFLAKESKALLMLTRTVKP
jgi:hypothetical protein